MMIKVRSALLGRLWVGGALAASASLVACSSGSGPAPTTNAGAPSNSAGNAAGGLSPGGPGSGNGGAGSAAGVPAATDGGQASSSRAGASSAGASSAGSSNAGSNTAGSSNAGSNTAGSSNAGSNSAGSSALDPGTEGDGDFTIGPTFQDSADERANGSAKKGTVKKFSMNSSDSKIYPNDVKTKQTFSRDVQVYIPNGNVANRETPFIVLQDGSQYAGDLITALDNLINDGRLPAIAGVFVNPGPGDGTGSERSLEYDSVSDKYSTFVETELLPKVEADYQLKFTKDPEGRAMMGGSSGGAAAFTAGWFHPELYRRILTYSGSFVNLQTDSAHPHGAWNYHETLIPGSDKKPLRVFLEAGSNDNGSTSSASSYRNWLIANQNMAAALKGKGYHYRFVFAQGASHVDTRAIRQSLPEALLWLWRGYVPPK
jgi:enterochelin esterase-like enzyme